MLSRVEDKKCFMTAGPGQICLLRSVGVGPFILEVIMLQTLDKSSSETVHDTRLKH